MRKDVLLDCGGFDSGLGYKGTKFIAGEEAELFYRMEQRGYKIIYVPDAVVYHRIPEERLTKQYVRKRAYGMGVSHVLFAVRREEIGRRKLLSEIQFQLREIIFQLCRILNARIRVRGYRVPLWEQVNLFHRFGALRQWIGLLGRYRYTQSKS